MIGWSVNIRDWVYVYGMVCSFRGWGVCIWDPWRVSKRDGVLVYELGC